MEYNLIELLHMDESGYEPNQDITKEDYKNKTNLKKNEQQGFMQKIEKILEDTDTIILSTPDSKGSFWASVEIKINEREPEITDAIHGIRTPFRSHSKEKEKRTGTQSSSKGYL